MGGGAGRGGGGGVYCFQIVRDSEFVSVQYVENELIELNLILSNVDWI